MPGLNDFNISVRTREVIYKVAQQAVLDLYPLPRYATVTAVDAATRKVTVQYPDEAGTFVISGMALLPTSGQIVRVNGDQGARYVDDMKATTDQFSSAFTIPASSHGTSERAAISLGDWQVGQDLLGNGTKDFFFYNGATRLNIGTGGRIDIGNSGETLRFKDTGAYISFYNSSTREGYLQGNSTGLILNSEVGSLRLIGGSSGGLSLEGGTVNFNSNALSNCGTINNRTVNDAVVSYRLVSAGANGYIYGNYFNMTSNTPSVAASYLAGQDSSDNFLRWYSNFSIGGTGRANRIEGVASGNQYTNCAIAAFPNSGVAAITFYTSDSPMIGSNAGFGTNMYFRNSAWNSNSSNCYSAGWNSDSSVRWKKNINPWPLKAAGAAVESATDLLCKLRPITYQPAVRNMELLPHRRELARQRLNRIRERKGEPEYEIPEHDCAIHDCNGTADSPCCKAWNHERQKFGMTAEEVYEVFPQVTSLDLDMKPVSIEYGQLTVVAIAAIQELVERIKVLEGADNG